MKKPWLLLFAGLLCWSCTHSGEQCYKYESEKISLAGTIEEKIFPGPPNYEDIKKGDRPETVWILRLDKPACVVPVDPKDDIDEPESNVRAMHLIIDDYGKYRSLPGKHVSVQGTLTHSISGHHRTKVLIEVTEIKVLKRIEGNREPIETARKRQCKTD